MYACLKQYSASRWYEVLVALLKLTFYIFFVAWQGARKKFAKYNDKGNGETTLRSSCAVPSMLKLFVVITRLSGTLPFTNIYPLLGINSISKSTE